MAKQTTDILELKRRRADAAEFVRVFDMIKVPTDPRERLKLEARYQRAVDAQRQAECDYQSAVYRR